MSLAQRIAVLLRTHVLPRFGGDPRPARLAFIERYRFPQGLRARFAAAHPELGAGAQDRVFEALTSFFAVRALMPDGIAGMPSRIVEDAWRLFAADPGYAAFCERAFGHILMPPADAASDEAIARTWAIACARERIESRRPSRLPALFALDRELKVPNGRYYALNDSDSEMARRMLGVSALIMMAGTLAQPQQGDPAAWDGAIAEAASFTDTASGLSGDVALAGAADFDGGAGGDFGGSS